MPKYNAINKHIVKKAYISHAYSKAIGIQSYQSYYHY